MRQAQLDRRQELISFIIFLALASLVVVTLQVLPGGGYLGDTSDPRLYLSLALGLILACALVSSLTFMISLRHWLLVVSLLTALLAAGAIAAGAGELESAAKLVFAAATGLWISLMLSSISQVLIIAALIVVVDIYSVFMGPTKKIVESGGPVVDYLTIALPSFGVPAAQRIGISDFIFFAIFIGCALTFRLRRTATALATTLSFVATMVISDSLRAGMPALPLLSLSFLAMNADLLYRRFLEEPDERRRAPGKSA